MEYNIPPCFYRVSVKALIHNDEGKFFLVQDEFGNWELPGGGIDHDESIDSCIQREIFEETGMTVVSISPEPSYFLTCIFSGKNIKNIPIVNVIYEVTVQEILFNPKEECIAGGFFSRTEALELPQSNHTQEFLKHYNPKNHANG